MVSVPTVVVNSRTHGCTVAHKAYFEFMGCNPLAIRPVKSALQSKRKDGGVYLGSGFPEILVAYDTRR
jgi:hypothetical protein